MSLKSTFSRLSAAVLSRDKAAYFGMLIIALKPIGKLFRGKDKAVKLEQVPPSLLIISPPRSGSTITYQVIANHVPCVYYSNLHEIQPAKASDKLIKQRGKARHSSYKSYFGYTYGWKGVNEGNDVVSSFLEGNPSVDEIRSRFLDFCAKMKASKDYPLVFKNVRNYANVSKLHEAIPELKFLRVMRSMEMVVQSELKAHYTLKSYHPIPPELVDKTNILAPPEFVVRQIASIENELDTQTKSMSKGTCMTVSYEEFCESPTQTLEEILEFIGGNGVLAPLNVKLKASSSQKVSDEDLQQIRKHISSLNG